MSTDNAGGTACPSDNNDNKNNVSEEKLVCKKTVSFPEDDGQLITQYFEPENPWKHVLPTTHAKLVAEYMDACKRHDTPPIGSVVQQIQELSERAVGGVGRASRLCLSDCYLRGTRAIDALEALLCRVQYRRLELHDTTVDDEAAEALFDMIEYYESANILNITGSRDFGIRGWQACSRMIKKSAELSEIEIRDAPLEESHAEVLARSLRPYTCRLRSLCLTRANLCGEPLICLVTLLKINNSVRELKLGDNGLTVADAELLASLLQYNTRIQLLDLSNNVIQDKGVYYLTEALIKQSVQTPPSTNTSPLSPLHPPYTNYEGRGLNFLVLWNNHLTKESAQYLSDALRGSRSLRVLNIGRNDLGAHAANTLSCSAPLLASLGLQAAGMGDDAAGHIARLIHSSSLQRIDLRDNKFGLSGLELILGAMKENKTLTQIDLDDAQDSNTLSPDSTEMSEKARLIREIRTLCRNNEPAASEHTPHRKISLTCHSMRSPPMEECRRGRLRSPAPSPASSPVPTKHSRFSVTRVTPDREASSDSSTASTPTRSNYSPTSRFKVVQVTDPPKVKVNQEKMDTPKPSRFSVSRNYDSMYSIKPNVVKNDTKSDKIDTKSEITKKATNVPDRDKRSDTKSLTSDTKSDKETKYRDKSEHVTHNESITKDGIDIVHVSETKLLKSSTEVSGGEKVDVKVEVTVTKETVESSDKNSVNKPAKVHSDQIERVNVAEKECAREFKNIDDISIRKAVDNTIKKIESVITEDLDNIIQEIGDLSNKTHLILHRKTVSKTDLLKDNVSKEQMCGVIVNKNDIVPVSVVRENVVLKKNKSESSLDSPDLEVSRLMNKKIVGSAFCDSNSSISGSSMESLNNPENTSQIIISKVETLVSERNLDRRKTELILSTDNSLDSNNSELTPVNSAFLNTSLSSNDSVSPIPFGKNKKIHGSLSSLEVSVSSLDSGKFDKIMVTSADSGIEHSLQNPSEIREEASSNEGTLTHNFSFKDINQELKCVQDTLTGPKRVSSLLDVPAFKTKSLDRVRKISWVAPSPSFHIPKEVEPPKPEPKAASHLDKLLSLFQHPSALFSRNLSEDEKRSASNTPPRKESTSMTSSFWSWGTGSSEKEKNEKDEKIAYFEDKDSSPDNATDSTLSERVQVSFVDESFSKKLDSKTPSTDSDNTLSELPANYTYESDLSQPGKYTDEKQTNISTEHNIVQKQLDLSVKNTESKAEDVQASATCDIANKDLIEKYDNPNDLKVSDTVVLPSGDAFCNTKIPDLENKLENKAEVKLHPEIVRPRTFAGVLKSSSNSLEKQLSPDSGQSVDKLSSKILRGIKENISPENTLTASMTKSLAQELSETRQIRSPENQQVVNSLWQMSLDKETNSNEISSHNKETEFEQDSKRCDVKTTSDIDNNKKLRPVILINKTDKSDDSTESIDIGKDALALLESENQDLKAKTEKVTDLAKELRDAEIKELQKDLSPELVIDEPELLINKEIELKTSPVIPERAKLKKSSSLEELSQRLQTIDLDDDNDTPKKSSIVFKLPEIGSMPKDIPETKRLRLRTRSGSSPKSLPDFFVKSPISKDAPKKKKKISSLGKMARDSLLALNMSEEEITEFRRSYKLTSVESLRSLSSVSEDACSQSGNSIDSRCRTCLKTSQESLMSLDSISEDCKCGSRDRDVCTESSHSAR